MLVVRRAYAIGSVVWLAMLPLGAYAATREHARAVVHAFAFAIYSIGSLVCHQRPERSFHLWAAQLPVCARCTGIYVGAALVALVARGFQPSVSRRPKLLARQPRMALAVASLPTVVTLVYEWTTGDMPSNWIRFTAGLPLGAVVSWLVIRVN